MDFSGHLSAFPASSILQWASNERRTGALVVRRTRCEKRIYFRDGRVVACLSDDPGESYGRYLLLQGYVDEDGLVRGLQRCRQTGRRLGAVLAELGTLSEAQVRESLHRQFSNLVCDIFLWQRGIFYFETDEPPAEEIPPEPIDTMGLVLEGTRWIDEVARIRQVLVHENVVLRHGPKYPEEGLTPYENRIGASVDSRSNLADLYAIIRGSYFRFLDTAHRMCQREVLEVFRVGDPYEPSSGDLKLSELILERSREGALSVPVSALGALYPVLAAQPGKSQLGRSQFIADFLATLDGRKALGDLLSDDRDRAEQQLETVLIEMRQGRLALLPAPPHQLEAKADRGGAPAAGRWWRRLLKPKQASP